MRKIALSAAVFGLLIGLAITAQARWKVANTACSAQHCKLLDAVAANAAAASRTFEIDTAGWVKATIQVDYVYSAGTAVTLTCQGSLNQGTSYASITSTSVGAGTGTVTAYVDSFAISAASANFLLEYDVRTLDRLKCVAAVTGGGANDKVTVYAAATRYKTNEMPTSSEQ